MTLPNDSVTVANDGAGNAMATHLVNAKEYPVVMVAGESGHIHDSLPSYTLWIPPQVVGASKLMMDLFNAVGSGKLLKLMGAWAVPKVDVAVTGVVGVEMGLYRTSAVGTGGTGATYNTGSALTAATITPNDTLNATLPAGITARSAPTGGATISAPYFASYIPTEETATSMAHITQYQNLLPQTRSQERVLREGQGMLFKQGTVAGVGSIGFLVDFSLI